MTGLATNLIPSDKITAFNELNERVRNKFLEAINNPSQDYLFLSSCELLSKDIILISDLLSIFPGITKLILENNYIGDEGAQVLAGNQTITTLNLFNNNISDEGAIALAGNQTITTLDVSGNNIGDEGARALAESQTITKLRIEDNKIGVEHIDLINAMLRRKNEETAARKLTSKKPGRFSLFWLAAKKVASMRDDPTFNHLPRHLKEAVHEAAKFI